MLELGRFDGDSGRSGAPGRRFGKTLYVTCSDRPAEYLNIDPSVMADAGDGPETRRANVTL